MLYKIYHKNDIFLIKLIAFLEINGLYFKKK